jgi:hypothetical protein
MGEAFSTHVEGEKCIKNVGIKTRRKEKTWESYAQKGRLISKLILKK